MHRRTITELARHLRDKDISSAELTNHFLERIDAKDPGLNAFITVDPERALARAGEMDGVLAKGEGGPLTGIPIAHKDIFCTKGMKTSCGSRMLDNFISPYDATVVERLQDAGAVVLGKTNMDEFAMGSSSETGFFGPVRNPWDTQRVAGGSSGGSAAAVAAGLVAGATGTDTGGSIRQPAAMTGVTGLKPTYGRVSRYGMVAFASSLDQGGTLTATAEDAALLLGIIAGFDPKDSTSADEPVPSYLANINESLEGLRIGVPAEFMDERLDAGIAQAVKDALSVYAAAGAELKSISLPNVGLAVATYYVVACAEASSNLSRFDGVRFGHRCKEPKDLMDLYKRTRGEAFGAEVKRRIMTGTYVLSAGYFDAYYLQAQRVRQLISADFRRALEEVDVVVGPTTPTPAFELGEQLDDPVAMYLNDIYTTAVNLAGLPGMSIPCGMTNGLPVGLQIIGAPFAEAKLLNVAHRFQQESDWHRSFPDE